MHTHIASIQTNYKTENLIKLPKVAPPKKKTETENAFAKDREAHNQDGAKTILVAFESLQKIAPTDSQNDREKERRTRRRDARAQEKHATLGCARGSVKCYARL
jgi:hypothetical protein